ncbi:MAG: Gfo/Idh/MocA family oxidoreductase [Collinsella sp.]
MLRIATIGTSMITDDFIQVVNANDQAAFVGTLSRDADRGGAFTAKHGGERNFTVLDELASADDVDAVYIGSPMRFTTGRSPARRASTLSSKSPSAPPRRRRSRSFAQPRRRAS